MMEEKKDEVQEYEPAPSWKRKAAWGLVVILVISIIIWLISIAQPNWVEIVRSWF